MITLGLSLGLRPIVMVMNLGIAPDTPPEKMEEAVRIVKEVLAAPDIAAAFDRAKHPPRVAFDAMAAEAFNIKIFYWHYPGEY